MPRRLVARGAVLAAGAIAALLAAPAAGFARVQGSPISEAGLAGRRDLLFFEDFETNSSGGTYTEDPRLVKFGRRSLRVMYKAGGHGTEGAPRKHPTFTPKLIWVPLSSPLL